MIHFSVLLKHDSDHCSCQSFFWLSCNPNSYWNASLGYIKKCFTMYCLRKKTVLSLLAHFICGLQFHGSMSWCYSGWMTSGGVCKAGGNDSEKAGLVKNNNLRGLSVFHPITATNIMNPITFQQKHICKISVHHCRPSASRQMTNTILC